MSRDATVGAMSRQPGVVARLPGVAGVEDGDVGVFADVLVSPPGPSVTDPSSGSSPSLTLNVYAANTKWFDRPSTSLPSSSSFRVLGEPETRSPAPRSTPCRGPASRRVSPRSTSIRSTSAHEIHGSLGAVVRDDHAVGGDERSPVVVADDPYGDDRAARRHGDRRRDRCTSRALVAPPSR